jgi:uncharacterized membrane protein
MANRFTLALGAYLVLAVLAMATLTGGIRLAVLILLAGLAAKTWIAHRMEE